MSAVLLILVPLITAVAIAAAPARLARWVALGGSIALVAVGVVVSIAYRHWTDGEFGFTASYPLIPDLGVTLSLGADSVSLLLVLLNVLLMPLCVTGSFTAVKEREREYYGWMMALAAAVNGVFLARDLVLFYVFFEFTLVPMYFLVAIFGGPKRDWAAVKFFLYTFTGSLFTLVGVVFVAWQHAQVTGTWTFDIGALTEYAANGLALHQQALVLLALMAGFAVKVPLFPVHTWLPLTHTEAPTAGSVLLAGVLLKLGTYGIYRFAVPMAPDAVVEYAPFIAILSIVGILYAALICWVQEDVKRLVAYSSVSHLGFCVLGLFALNPIGAQGSVMYMINHGLSTGALFLCIGMIYERYHTRDMNELGGLARRMPVWAFFMVFFTMSSVGLPGLNGFVGEFLCMLGAFSSTPRAETGYPGVLGPWFGIIAGSGMIVAAMYLLMMVGRVVFGPLREPRGHGDHEHDGDALPVDLTAREIAILVPLAIVCIVIGLFPKPFLDAIEPSVERTLAAYPAIVEEQLVARAPAAAGEQVLAGSEAPTPVPAPLPAGLSAPATVDPIDGAVSRATDHVSAEGLGLPWALRGAAPTRGDRSAGPDA